MINGFDKDVDLNLTGDFQRTFDAYVLLMSDLNIKFLTARNNLQVFRKAGIQSGRLAHSHAAPLAASALVLGNLWGRFYIPGARPFDGLVPDGAHPILDHLFSTEEVLFSHDGAQASRPQKIEAISSWPEVLRRLRVCFRKPTFNSEGVIENCCQCPKCVDTMLALDLLGVLPDCVTFPHPLRRSQIWRTAIRPQLRREYLDLARRHGRKDRILDLKCSSLRSGLKSR